MVRLPIVGLLAVPLLLAAACENKQAAGTAPAQLTAEPSTPTPVATAAQPTPAAQPAAAADAAPPDSAPGAAAPVDPQSLAGQYAFGWSGGKTMKCKKVDEKMLKKLAGKDVMCRHRDPGEAFAEGAGLWSTCQVGKAEWVIFSTRAICQEQLETMEANAP